MVGLDQMRERGEIEAWWRSNDPAIPEELAYIGRPGTALRRAAPPATAPTS